MAFGEYIVVVGSQVVPTSRSWRVAASTSSVTAAEANGSRLTLKLTNDSVAEAWILYDEGAASDNYSWPLGPGERWEMPTVVINGSTRPEHSGIVTMVWASAVGAVQVNEITT